MFGNNALWGLQGGLKAVVWTDALQLIVLVASSFVVIGLGVAMVGGPRELYTRADNGGRIELLK